MTKELNREVEDQESNQPEGDSEEVEDLFADEQNSDDSGKSSSLSDDPLSDGALEAYNEKVGKKYKSWEDVAKSEKQRDKDFAQKGKEKEKIQESESPSEFKYPERLLKLENENSQYVLNEIREIAKKTNTDPLDVWEKYSWIRNEADVRAEEAKGKKDSEGKVNKPSRKISGTAGGDEELTSADRDLLKVAGISQEEYQKRKAKE